MIDDLDPARASRNLDPPDPAASRRVSLRARTALIGALLFAFGIGASALLAVEWRSSRLDANRKAFHSTARDLSTALGSKLAANIDLTRAMRARASTDASNGESSFLRWYRELRRGAPATPGVVGTFIQPVPASRLSAFRRQAENDPAFRTTVAASLRVIPPGRRPLYCLTRAMVGSSPAVTLSPGLLDYCAPVLPGVGRSPYPGLLHTAIDTGEFIVAPLATPSSPSLVAIGAAVYRPGAALPTAAARRAAVKGFIGTTFDSAALIGSVFGHRSLSAALYHRDLGGPRQLIGRVRADPGSRSDGYSQTVDLGEGWLVEVTGRPGGVVAADLEGLSILGSGLLVSSLIFLVYRLLARSRELAWTVVGEKTEELEYRALHDALTDLPNRTLVIDRADQILARARRLDAPATALFMDIDGFKQINDRYGHQAGDEVLRQVGARLRTVLRGSDTVGRLGGDEFVMLIDPVGLDVAPELVAERILAVLRQPFDLSGAVAASISATASIGIATGLPGSSEQLLMDADVALYRAKALGKDGYVLFESAMQTAAQDRIHLEMDLAEALDADQFFLAYQPMLDLGDERIVGAEALLRWRHPTRGVVAPDAFIPIAEESGLIVPIGRWVLDRACAQAASWQRRGHPLGISVNVSARQLERPEFAAEVATALRDSALEPTSLTLEITETALMRKPEATARLLGQLKELGVRIAVDDFGTGYSSLAYLRQFPVDSLKIDRSFISDLEQSGQSHALTHTLIQLGKALGLQTLAEGVEQPAQARQLLREGCDLAQGFLFSRPLTPSSLERYMDDQRHGVRVEPRRTSSPVGGSR